MSSIKNIVDVAVYIENEANHNNYLSRLIEEKNSLIKPNYSIIEQGNSNLEMKVISTPNDEIKSLNGIENNKHYVISIFGKKYIPSLIDLRINNSDIIITDNKEKITDSLKSKEKSFEFLDELIEKYKK